MAISRKRIMVFSTGYGMILAKEASRGSVASERVKELTIQP